MTNAGLDDMGHPVGKIDDVTIIGVHYSNFSELKSSWEKRKNRIDYSNLFIISTDEFISSSDEKNRFDKLPYPKICFVANKNVDYDWQIFLPKYQGCRKVGDSMVYASIFGQRINELYFDFIYWLNNKKIKTGK